MATRSFIGWILVFMAILTIFAKDSPTVTGVLRNVSFSIGYGSTPATNPNDIQVKVYCSSVRGLCLPFAVLIPGEAVFHTWTPTSYFDDIWTCNFEIDLHVPTAHTFKQSFPVFKHNLDENNFLRQCEDCIWRIELDGFYFWSDDAQAWILEYAWVQTS
ncbi:unnamed protein product [Calypogeia fissa]